VGTQAMLTALSQERERASWSFHLVVGQRPAGINTRGTDLRIFLDFSMSPFQPTPAGLRRGKRDSRWSTRGGWR